MDDQLNTIKCIYEVSWDNKNVELINNKEIINNIQIIIIMEKL